MLFADFLPDDMFAILSGGAVLPYIAVAAMEWIRGKYQHYFMSRTHRSGAYATYFISPESGDKSVNLILAVFYKTCRTNGLDPSLKNQADLCCPPHDSIYGAPLIDGGQMLSEMWHRPKPGCFEYFPHHQAAQAMNSPATGISGMNPED